MNRCLRAAATAATLFVGGTLFAQTVRANIPFDFYVGNTAMPAGMYDVAPCTTQHQSDLLMVRHCTEGIAAMHLALPAGTVPKFTGALVFHRYGEKYFLNEVQLPASGNLTLPVGPLERSVQTEEGQVHTFENVTVPKAEEPNKP